MKNSATAKWIIRPADQPPPSHYSDEAKGLWTDVLDGWPLDPPAQKILSVACDALMTMRKAQERLKRDGLTTKDRFGLVKVHPLVLVERDSQATPLAALKALTWTWNRSARSGIRRR